MLSIELIHLVIFWTVVIVLIFNVIFSLNRHLRLNKQIALLTEIRDLLQDDKTAERRKPGRVKTRTNSRHPGYPNVTRGKIIDFGNIRK